MIPLHQNYKEGDWEGRRAFIIGGGPSLRGFDFSVLRGETVIAVNGSHRKKAGKVSDLVFTGDLRWVRRHPREVPKRLPVVYARRETPGKPLPPNLPREIFLTRATEEHPSWNRTFEEGITPGDSGLRATHFAAIMGADPIYLLGFDMRIDGRRLRHWHGGYGLIRRPDRGVYVAYVKFWRELFSSGKVGSNIINLTPSSALDGIVPKKCLEEALSNEGENP